MKFIALAALLGLATAADVEKTIPLLGHKGENPTDKIKAAKILAGFMEPFVGDIDPMALMVCVLDVDEVLLTLDTIVHIVEEAISTKQYPELIVAVITLGGAYKEIQQAIVPCSEIHPSKDFDKAKELLEHPLANLKIVGDDVKLAGVSIIEPLKNAIANYKNGDFEGFGKDFGELIKKASEKEMAKPADPEAIKLAHSLQGFFDATNVGHINIDALLFCIYDEDNALIATYLGFLALKDAWRDRGTQQAFADLFIAATAAAAAYGTAREGIPACEAIDPKTLNFTDFDNIMHNFRSKETYERLEKNKKDVLEAIEAGVKGDYYNVGFHFGQAMMPKNDLFLY